MKHGESSLEWVCGIGLLRRADRSPRQPRGARRPSGHPPPDQLAVPGDQAATRRLTNWRPAPCGGSPRNDVIASTHRGRSNLRACPSLTILVALCLFHFSCASSGPKSNVQLLRQASVTEKDGLPVVHLKGTPYEVGYQHGYLLRDQVRRANAQIRRYFARKLKVPILSRWVVNFLLDRSYRKMEPYIPEAYLEEMRGLADGSGVSLRNIHRVHVIPDLYSTLCSNGAFFGKATADGQLYHLRNLDWNREIGIQDYAAVFAYEIEGRLKFVNLGYISFIGSISGVNEEGISVGQIGTETKDQTLKGTPMPLLIRRILEESSDLETAIGILRDARRTIGCNYVIADAKAKRACAVESSSHHFQFFYDNDAKEKLSPFAAPVEGAVFRGDAALDPQVREYQTAAQGDPEKPGLEDPHGSSSYDVRYLGQAQFVQKNFGKIQEELTLELARTIAPGSNVQSVIFAFPRFWVANAEGTRRAVDSKYHEFEFPALFTENQ